MKKKRKANTPRHKTMKRNTRLQAAKYWILKYKGKNIIKGYSNYFGVNKLCAIKELEILGHKFKPEYIKQVKESLKAKEKARQQHKLQKKQEESLDNRMDSDETFYYIVGYTSGGAPYGVTWEEAIKDGLVEDNELMKDIISKYSWLEDDKAIHQIRRVDCKEISK